MSASTIRGTRPGMYASHRSVPGSARPCKRFRVHAQTDGSVASLRPLEVSRQIAAARWLESQREGCLFGDPYAQALFQTSPPDQPMPPEAVTAQDIIATKYIDECLMNAVAAVNINTINKGDYRQVVLLGDGMDSRPFRLPWPPGTLLYVVAQPEVHELAEAVVKQAGGVVPRGCLLRRVSVDLQGGASIITELERAGFRGDRLSVWAVQGLHGLSASLPALKELFADVTNMAAFHSLVLGELPGLARSAADNFLAEFGLLGSVREHSEPEVNYGRWREEWQVASGSDERLLFTSQQLRLSLYEMGVYEAHVEAAEEADEDFFGNFS